MRHFFRFSLLFAVMFSFASSCNEDEPSIETLVDEPDFKIVQKVDGKKVFTGKLRIDLKNNFTPKEITVKSLNVDISGEGFKTTTVDAVLAKDATYWTVSLTDFPLDVAMKFKAERKASDNQTDELEATKTYKYDAKTKKFEGGNLTLTFAERLSWESLSPAWKKALSNALGKGKVVDMPSQSDLNNVRLLTALKWRGKSASAARFEHENSEDKIAKMAPLKHMPLLTKVELQGNALTSVDAKVLEALKTLEDLNLSKNKITKFEKLETSVFTLKKLHLNGNQLSYGEASFPLGNILKITSNLIQLYLYGQKDAAQKELPWSVADQVEIRKKAPSKTKIHFIQGVSVSGISDQSENKNPGDFALSAPAENAVEVAAQPVFTWVVSIDPDGDAVEYDVFLDKNNPPKTKVKEGLTSREYTHSMSSLTLRTKYYWYVLAKDGRGGSKKSAVQAFTTISDLNWSVFPEAWKRALNYQVNKTQVATQPSPEDLQKLLALKTFQWRAQSFSGQEEKYYDFELGVTQSSQLKTLDPLQYLRNLDSVIITGSDLKDLGTTGAVLSQLKKLITIRIQSSKVTALSEGQFQGLTKLKNIYLDHNEITSLPPKVFQGLPSLYVIQIQNNKLTTIDGAQFKGLTNLYSVTASDNLIKALPANLLDNLSALYYFNFADNKISSIPQNLFSQVSVLAKIHLEGNEISSLPADVFSPIKGTVTDIRIERNQIAALPQNIFKGLTQLFTLYFSDNPVTAIPAGAFNDLEVLSDLRFSGAKVNALLPNTFSGLKGLTKVYLHGQKNSSDVAYSWTQNQISSVRFEILLGAKIYFSNDSDFLNGRKGVKNTLPTKPTAPNPPDVYQNIEVKFSWEASTDADKDPVSYALYFGTANPPTTKVSGDNLSETTYTREQLLTPGATYYWQVEASDGAGGSTKSEVFIFDTKSKMDDVLNWNLLSDTWRKALNNAAGNGEVMTAPSNVAEMKKILEVKNLNWTGKADKILVILPVKHLTKLEKILLGGNSIGAIPIGLLTKLKNLRQFSFYKNQLTALPDDIFSGLANLKFIDLAGNDLTTLPTGIFSGSTALTDINLAGNDLTTLLTDLFSSNTKLTLLNLKGNKLNTILDNTFTKLDALETLYLNEQKKNDGTPYSWTTNQRTAIKSQVIITADVYLDVIKVSEKGARTKS